MTTLLTTTTPSKEYPGVVPTYPVARHLARRLIEAGESVRILTNATELPWPSEAHVIEGSPAEPSRSPQAFVGIDRLFLADADPATVRELLTRSVEGGLRRAVVLSSHGPDVEIEFEPDSWHWLAIEVVIERTVPEWVHVRPSPLMGSVLVAGEHHPTHALADLVRSRASIGVPRDDAPYPHIHEDDLALIAARALIEPGFAGRVLDLIGPLTSMRDKIDAIRAGVGRDVTTHELVPEDREGIEPPSGFEHDPEAEEALASLLGRPARDFASWFDEHAEHFRG